MHRIFGHIGLAASGFKILGLIDSPQLHYGREANRDCDWVPHLMAIVGIVECLLVPEGSTVRVLIRQKALIDAINREFVRSDGSFLEGYEQGQRLKKALRDRRITLLLEHVPKRKNGDYDRFAALVKREAKREWDERSAKGNLAP